jgi:hypothetical protein
MRRDLLYLGAVIVNVALMVELGYPLVLTAIGPAWVLRRGSLRPLWTGPLAVIALAVLVPMLLDALGADCPVQGMDYLDQCNGLATAGLFVLYGGMIALEVSAVAAVCVLLIRAACAVLRSRGR